MYPRDSIFFIYHAVTFTALCEKIREICIREVRWDYVYIYRNHPLELSCKNPEEIRSCDEGPYAVTYRLTVFIFRAMHPEHGSDVGWCWLEAVRNRDNNFGAARLTPENTWDGGLRELAHTSDWAAADLIRVAKGRLRNWDETRTQPLVRARSIPGIYGSSPARSRGNPRDRLLLESMLRYPCPCFRSLPHPLYVEYKIWNKIICQVKFLKHSDYLS